MNRLALAIYDAVHAFGTAKLAEMMRVSHQTMINKVNPEQQAHSLTLDQFLLILEVTESKQIISALADHAQINTPETTGNNLTMAILGAAKESADVLAVFQAEAADGHWSMRDAAKLEQEAAEATEALARAVAVSYELAKAGGHIRAVA